MVEQPLGLVVIADGEDNCFRKMVFLFLARVKSISDLGKAINHWLVDCVRDCVEGKHDRNWSYDIELESM